MDVVLSTCVASLATPAYPFDSLKTNSRIQGFPSFYNNKPIMQATNLQSIAQFPISPSFPKSFSRKICRQREFTCRAYVKSESEMKALQKTKLDLLRAAQDTQRGLLASDDQRANIEEAMVSVERYDAGTPMNLSQLDGTWLLQYTSASDVIVLLEAAKLPFLQVGQIFQKFECKGCTGGGVVRNVVRWSIPSVLQENEGATLLVTAKFSVLTQRNIFLQFEEVTVGNLMISEELQALIAPAILPRTFLSLEILQFLRGFKTKIPLRDNGDQQANRRPSLGGLYYLSYLDRDMLLGRALGGGGVFIFSRTQPLQV
eukprot:Gb_23571 [translate_table: standard]